MLFNSNLIVNDLNSYQALKTCVIIQHFLHFKNILCYQMSNKNFGVVWVDGSQILYNHEKQQVISIKGPRDGFKMKQFIMADQKKLAKKKKLFFWYKNRIRNKQKSKFNTIDKQKLIFLERCIPTKKFMLFVIRGQIYHFYFKPEKQIVYDKNNRQLVFIMGEQIILETMESVMVSPEASVRNLFIQVKRIINGQKSH